MVSNWSPILLPLHTVHTFADTPEFEASQTKVRSNLLKSLSRAIKQVKVLSHNIIVEVLIACGTSTKWDQLTIIIINRHNVLSPLSGPPDHWAPE